MRSGTTRWAACARWRREIKNSGAARPAALSCSIGITPNKLLSKIASELDKPDGLTVVTEADIPGVRVAAGRCAS